MTSNTQIPIKKANVFYYDELVIRSIILIEGSLGWRELVSDIYGKLCIILF